MSCAMLVPVIDVQSNNFLELWPAMVLAFKSSSFIAVDTELSGLGARKALLAESIEDRYKAISHAARTRSILSLGIACYKKLDGKADYTYLVQVYNLTLLCAEEYIIEPQSVQFLVQHGFDFNKQYAQGVAYNKGNDKGEAIAHGINVRTLFVELLRANKPLVLHNGLIDLVFLYQCFYAHLPERLGTFTADLSQMFPAGIYDTKYAVEYELRFPASYLEYAYKKCKLDNSRSVETEKEERRVVLEFCNYSGQLQSYVDYRPCADSQNHGSAAEICVQFSGYGWCPNGAQCPMSHDTDLIIRQDEKSKEDKRKKRKRRKRKKAGTEEEEEPKLPQDKKAHLENVDGGTAEVASDNILMKCTDSTEQRNEDREGDDGEIQSSPVRDVPPASTEEPTAEVSRNAPSRDSSRREVDTGTHRAGFDAFMTGFIFAYANVHSSGSGESEFWISGCENKLYLSGKSVPLHVAKSTFSKSSRAHVMKMEQVWGKRISNN